MATNSTGARGDRRAARKAQGGGRSGAADLTFRERLGALRNLPPLFRLVWQTSPSLFATNLALRLVQAADSGHDALRGQADRGRGGPPGERRRRARRVGGVGRPARNARRADRGRVRAGPLVGPAQPGDGPVRLVAGRPVHERDLGPPDAPRGGPRPGPLRGRRLLRPARTGPPPDDEPAGAAEPDLRPGPGLGHRRLARRRASGVPAVAAGPARARAGAGVPGRGPLQRPELLAGLLVDARAPRARLPPVRRRERRDGQGGQGVRAQRLPRRALPDLGRRLLPGQPDARRPPRVVGRARWPPSGAWATTWPTPSSCTGRLGARSPSAT